MQNVRYLNNEAKISGNSLYGGLLDRCIVTDLAESRNIDSKFHSKDELSHGIRYFKAISNIHTMDIGTPPVKVCFCKSNQHNCTYQHPPVNTDRGEILYHLLQLMKWTMLLVMLMFTAFSRVITVVFVNMNKIKR